ncbi:polygalacturonase-like [Cornus florida]|uniref:polygalacturonase-like n=1 Tax=Cornus florida TaxID=4283 RepID=UPI002896EDEA|nr:polygalacturonase-like [Cornus florida]
MGLRLSIKAISLLLILAHVAEGGDFDVTKYGAKPNCDVKQALMSAWKEACLCPTPSTVTIPPGVFPCSPVVLEGPCKAPIGVVLKGNLKAPGLAQIPTDAWIVFQKVNGFTLSGGGSVDGMGADAWKTKNTKRPANLRFNFVNNSVITDITTKDPKMFHMTVLGGSNMTFAKLNIIAPGDSHNTDGLHIARSNDIKVLDSKIATGDDCVSFGDGVSRILIEKITCGPGHGISIGSLGKYPNEQPIQGITVKDCTFSNTTNGVRIKTWPGSPPSIAADMHFEDLTMKEVSNPIIIDQEYCDSNLKCPPKPPSQVKISKVSFKNIHGSSLTDVAIKLVCSKSVPCQEVELGNIDLTFKGGAAKSLLTALKPTCNGKIIPAVGPA